MCLGKRFMGGKGVGGPNEVVIIDNHKFLELWRMIPWDLKDHLLSEMRLHGTKIINFIMLKSDFRVG